MNHDWQFWAAVLGASVFKLLTSTTLSVVTAVATVLSAVLVAWAFTDAAVAYFALNPATYKIPVAALLALTGEGIARTLINWAADPLRTLRELASLRNGDRK